MSERESHAKIRKEGSTLKALEKWKTLQKESWISWHINNSFSESGYALWPMTCPFLALVFCSVEVRLAWFPAIILPINFGHQQTTQISRFQPTFWLWHIFLSVQCLECIFHFSSLIIKLLCWPLRSLPNVMIKHRTASSSLLLCRDTRDVLCGVKPGSRLFGGSIDLQKSRTRLHSYHYNSFWRQKGSYPGITNSWA